MVKKTKARGKIRIKSRIFQLCILFIILNILARVRITKIGYRSILPSGGRGFLSLRCLILNWEIEFEFSRKFVFAVKAVAKVDTADSAICMNLNIQSL